MRKQTTTALLAACCGLLFTACQKPAETAKPADAPRAVTAQRPIERSVIDGLELSGSLAAMESSDVVSEVEGVVIEVLTEAGQPVADRAPLLRLNAAGAKLRLEQARAAERQAKAAFEQAELRLGGGKTPENMAEVKAARARADAATGEAEAARLEATRTARLLASGDVSRSENDKAQAALRSALAAATAAREQATAAVNAARQDLSAVTVARAQWDAAKAAADLADKGVQDAVIRAPFAGWVSQRPLSKGEWVGMGTKVATVEKTDRLRVLLQAPESAALRPGMAIQLTVPAVSPDTIPTQILAVNPIVQKETRAVLIEAQIPNPAQRWKPGMLVTAQVAATGARPGWFVPDAAVLTDPSTEGRFLWLADKGRAKLLPVRLGQRVEGTVEIRSGLGAASLVLVPPPADLFEGQPLNVQEKR